MESSIIDLKIFAPKYRQAILYTMIEGLSKGHSFTFYDDRSSTEIENELAAAGLSGYHWFRKVGITTSEAGYVIERELTSK